MTLCCNFSLPLPPNISIFHNEIIFTCFRCSFSTSISIFNISSYSGNKSTTSFNICINFSNKALEELIKDPEIIPPALIFPVVAIASIYAFAQYNDVVPKSLALSVDGTRG